MLSLTLGPRRKVALKVVLAVFCVIGIPVLLGSISSHSY